MPILKTSKKDKGWFAQRCDESLVKTFPRNISVVLNDALQCHEMENTPENRRTLKEADNTPRKPTTYSINSAEKKMI